MKSRLFITALFIIASFLTSEAQYIKLLDFDGASNGSSPDGSLISDGTFLYGVTPSGGTHNDGVIFKIKPDGSGYSNLFDFFGPSFGKQPSGSLIYDGTFLYGMTTTGIFKIRPDGTGFAMLHNFYGVTGNFPYRNSLYLDGNFLYGMTNMGGTSNMGVIFKVRTDGSGYTVLLDFTGANGSRPFSGKLISDGTFLYGMTYKGGISDSGTVFKVKPDGTGYSKLLDFTNDNGGNPWGSLFFDGIFLYGMTSNGGINDRGIVFKIKSDGTGFSKIYDFAGSSNGDHPEGSLIYDGTFLYAMTPNGGGTSGDIFRIKPDGNGYTQLFDFGGTNGSYPHGSLISDGTFFYGMTEQGGTNGYGVIFKFQPVIISGRITTETGIPISGVSVRLSGDDSQVRGTDLTGGYSFSVEPGGDYTVKPSKSYEWVPTNGVSSMDVLLMRRHILGIAPLGSPYKIIAAAEVNSLLNDAIDVTDIVLTQSFILGTIISFPTDRLWQFVRSDYVFPDSTHPSPFPTSRTHNNVITDQSNQNFIGIKLGDVNYSWDPNIR